MTLDTLLAWLDAPDGPDDCSDCGHSRGAHSWLALLARDANATADPRTCVLVAHNRLAVVYEGKLNRAPAGVREAVISVAVARFAARIAREQHRCETCAKWVHEGLGGGRCPHTTQARWWDDACQRWGAKP
jgi:hypothetical protein